MSEINERKTTHKFSLSGSGDTKTWYNLLPYHFVLSFIQWKIFGDAFKKKKITLKLPDADGWFRLARIYTFVWCFYSTFSGVRVSLVKRINVLA